MSRVEALQEQIGLYLCGMQSTSDVERNLMRIGYYGWFHSNKWVGYDDHEEGWIELVLPPVSCDNDSAVSATRPVRFRVIPGGKQ